MNGLHFCIYDPLRDEWATLYPMVRPMTSEYEEAALFTTEAAAVIRARELIGPDRPWLVMRPVCPCCGEVG